MRKTLTGTIVVLWGLLMAIAAFGQSPPGAQCVASAVAGGAPDAITIPALPCALTTNLLILSVTATNATTTPTLQPLGSPAQTIIRAGGGALAAGDLPAGYRALLNPTGQQWILLNPALSGSSVPTVTPQQFGAKGTGLEENYLVTASSSSCVINFAQAPTGASGYYFTAPAFNVSQVNAPIWFSAGGAANAALSSTIAQVNSATQIVLAAGQCPQTSQAGTKLAVVLGFDDTAALQEFYSSTALGANFGTLPCGGYIYSSPLMVPPGSVVNGFNNYSWYAGWANSAPSCASLIVLPGAGFAGAMGTEILGGYTHQKDVTINGLAESAIPVIYIAATPQPATSPAGFDEMLHMTILGGSQGLAPASGAQGFRLWDSFVYESTLDCVLLNTDFDWSLSRTETSGCGAAGVHLNGASNGSITDGLVQNNGSYGFVIAGTVHNVNIDTTRVITNFAGGVQFSGFAHNGSNNASVEFGHDTWFNDGWEGLTSNADYVWANSAHDGCATFTGNNHLWLTTNPTQLYTVSLIKGGTINPIGGCGIVINEELTPGIDGIWSYTNAAALASVTWSGGVATYTTAVPHTLGNSGTMQMNLAGTVPIGYNGNLSCTLTGTSTFTCPVVSNPGAVTHIGQYGAGNTAAALQASWQPPLGQIPGPYASSATALSSGIPVGAEFQDTGGLLRIVVQPGTPSPSAGPPTPQGNLPFTPAVIVNVTDPQWNGGAKGDGVTDDWAAFQQAEGITPTSGGYCTYTQPTLVVVPSMTAAGVASYNLSQAIRLCPHVHLQVQSDSTKIYCSNSNSSGFVDYTGATGTSTWPFTGCILAGYLIGGSTFPTYAISGAATVGQTSFVLTTAANAGVLLQGDIVDVETTSTFNVSGGVPTAMRMAWVVSANASTGVVVLDRAVDFANSSVQLRKLTNLAGTGDWPTIINTLSVNSNIPQPVVGDCGVYGGQWIANGASPWGQAFNDGGGMLDCRIDVDYVQAANGVGWGNAEQDSYFHARRESILRVPLELAYSSSGTTVALDEVDMTPPGSTTVNSNGLLAIDEGSHDNNVRIGHVNDNQGQIGVPIAVSGTPAGGGGDVVPFEVLTPALTAVAVNVAGSGWNANGGGTFTWSGSGCSINPVLSATLSAGGAVAGVAILVPGVCTTLPSSTATTWTPGGGINSSGSGLEVTITGNLSYAATYTDVGGDTLTSIAAAGATNLTAASGFTSAGFTAAARSGSVYINNSAALPFYTSGGTSGAIVTYMPNHDIVRMGSGSRNNVIIGSVQGGAITGNVVEINSLPNLTGTVPSVSDNHVAIGTSNLAYQFGDVSIYGGTATNNVVDGGDGWFHGSTFVQTALWIQSNAGSYNVIKHVNSDAANGYPQCDVDDPTNMFDTVYTALSTPLTGLTGSKQIQQIYYCERRSVISASYQAMSPGNFEMFYQTPVGTSQLVAASPNISGLEQGDEYSFITRLALTGNVAAKPVKMTFFGLNSSTLANIPIDATGEATVECKFDAYAAPTNLRVTCTVESNSATPFSHVSTTGNTSYSTTVSQQATLTLGAMSSGDTATIVRGSGRFWRPSVDTRVRAP